MKQTQFAECFVIIIIITHFLFLKVRSLPLLQKTGFENPFVGFYVFPHGGVALDPINMDYSTQPGFSKADSKERAIRLHQGMRQAADSLIQSNPDLIIFSSPHGFHLEDHVLFVHSMNAAGDAGDIFEAFTASFDIEKDLTTILYAELKFAENPVEILHWGSGYQTIPLLWGEVIPWYFIKEAAAKAGRELPKAIYMGQSAWLNSTVLTNIGRDIVKTVLLREEFFGKRIAVVISGDLSHYHSTDPTSPYPFSPVSSVFDKFMTDWAQVDKTPEKQTESNDILLNKAGSIENDAGHCGYPGLVVLNGILEEVVNQKWSFKSTLYAYEVPSYFGMMVVSWTPM